MTKQASGNFYPLSSPLRAARRGVVTAAPQQNSKRRRARNAHNFGPSAVQIRCSCAKKKNSPPFRASPAAWRQLPLRATLRSGSSVWTSFRWIFRPVLFSLSWARRNVNAHAPPSLRAQGNSYCLARFALLLGNQGASVDIVIGISLRPSLNTFYLFKCT